MWLLSWYWPELILFALFWAVYVLAGTFGSEEMPGAVAVTWIAVGGFVAGAAAALGIPRRILPPVAFMGVSLLVAPAILGGAMELVGRRDARGRRPPSHLATWYGGATFGLGIALGRLGIMWHLGTL